MKSEIETRLSERKKDLVILEAAINVLKVHERTYAHVDGRIREVKSEIVWLKEQK